MRESEGGRVSDVRSDRMNAPGKVGASREDFSVIGKPLPKVDGLRKATGQAVYADDLNLPRMLYGKLVSRS